jgi:hypothetical protein
MRVVLGAASSESPAARCARLANELGGVVAPSQQRTQSQQQQRAGAAPPPNWLPRGGGAFPPASSAAFRTKRAASERARRQPRRRRPPNKTTRWRATVVTPRTTTWPRRAGAFQVGLEPPVRFIGSSRGKGGRRGGPSVSTPPYRPSARLPVQQTRAHNGPAQRPRDKEIPDGTARRPAVCLGLRARASPPPAPVAEAIWWRQTGALPPPHRCVRPEVGGGAVPRFQKRRTARIEHVLSIDIGWQQRQRDPIHAGRQLKGRLRRPARFVRPLTSQNGGPPSPRHQFATALAGSLSAACLPALSGVGRTNEHVARRKAERRLCGVGGGGGRVCLLLNGDDEPAAPPPPQTERAAFISRAGAEKTDCVAVILRAAPRCTTTAPRRRVCWRRPAAAAGSVRAV